MFIYFIMLNWLDNHFLLLRDLGLKCCEMSRFRFSRSIIHEVRVIQNNDFAILNLHIVLNVLLYFLRKENYAFDCKHNVTTMLSGLNHYLRFVSIYS
jgi:hypothetical protein